MPAPLWPTLGTMDWGSTTSIVLFLAALVGLALLVKQTKLEKPKQLEQLPPNHPDAPVSLLFVAGHGYRLLEIEPRALSAGSVLDLEGRTYVVAHLGPAPLPADGRRCAYVEPSAGRSPDSGS
jgi:hypothetical protein